MAFEYFLYRTDFNNTLVDRSDTSFAPLPPNTGQIFIDYFIPEIQPLYLYRESGGTIVINDDATIKAYLNATIPPTEDDYTTVGDLTGYTAATATKRILLVNNTIQDLNTIAGVNIQWDIILRQDSDYFGFTAGTDTIEILETGAYDVAMSVPMDYAGGGNQINNVGITLLINGVTDVDTYISATVNKDRQQTATLAGVQHDFTAGDLVQVEGYSLNGATQAVTVAGSVWFQITKVNA